ncbi:MAG: hypothetical protein J5825_05855 [Lachnospiraceae bacterium]|nr:hypothetical protein [Lachnospiraceae bacterium]
MREEKKGGMLFSDMKTFEDGSRIQRIGFELFRAKMYLPVSKAYRDDVINYGFAAPYLIFFEEQEMSDEEAKAYADREGISEIAAGYGSSVLFLYPSAEGGYAGAGPELFKELIDHSRIHQYYEDGLIHFRNRFTGNYEEWFVRGANFRTYVYGKGAAADYIATKLIREIRGQGLWGEADIAPAVYLLEGLSEVPVFDRRDVAVVSVANSEEINDEILSLADHGMITEHAPYSDLYERFAKHYRRWNGTLTTEPDLEEIGIVREPGVCKVKTSPDNLGDDKGTEEHEIGYFAFYRKGLLEEGRKLPVLLCFHGGGDSALYMADVSGWQMVAHDHDFLLIGVEHHMNSTATEAVELLEQLKSRYPIDETRVYCTGFSMGGCKSWDLYQEYPEVFAGAAPMDATFEVGLNVFGKEAPKAINRNTPVAVFYCGGAASPLPELSCQAVKCCDRLEYILQVNDCKKQWNLSKTDQSGWEDPVQGMTGDRVEKFYDESRGGTLTVHYFDSNDGRCITAFSSVDNQGHEVRRHTCEEAWKFLCRFSRVNGELVMGS